MTTLDAALLVHQLLVDLVRVELLEACELEHLHQVGVALRLRRRDLLVEHLLAKVLSHATRSGGGRAAVRDGAAAAPRAGQTRSLVGLWRDPTSYPCVAYVGNDRLNCESSVSLFEKANVGS